MKIYVKASTANSLEQYIGKNIWIRVQYKEYGSQKYSDDYLIKILEKISDTKYKCATIFKPFNSSFPKLTDRTDLYITTLRAKGITISEPLEVYTDEELFGESDYINKYEERKNPSATVEDISQFVDKDIWVKLTLKNALGDCYVKFEDITSDGTIHYYAVETYWRHITHNPYTLEELTFDDIKNEILYKKLYCGNLASLGIKRRPLLNGKQITTDELVRIIMT